MRCWLLVSDAHRTAADYAEQPFMAALLCASVVHYYEIKDLSRARCAQMPAQPAGAGGASSGEGTALGEAAAPGSG